MGDSTFHSPLSPSARHRWGVCPGSVREEAKHPEPPDGPAAIDGTRTHSLLERALLFEFGTDPEVPHGKCGPMPYFNLSITDEYGTYTVDAERCKRLNVALEYIRETLAEVGGTVVIPEKRVFPDGLVGRADMSGTVDVQIPGKNVFVVVDYKDGISPVQANGNPQLEQYALGVLAGLDQDKLPKILRLVIVQPKLAMKGLPVISTWEVTPADLLAYEVPRIIAQAAATDAPDAPLVPGESQCKYCRAKGSCTAQAGMAMKEVGLMFAPVNPAPVLTLEMGHNILEQAHQAAFDAHPWNKGADFAPVEVIPPGVMDMAQQAAAKDPTKMSVAQLCQVMEAAPLVRQFLEGVQDQIFELLKAGKTVPGFKLVQGPGRRGWALTEEEIVKKLKQMGLPTDAIYKKELISPAQAEKAVWDKKGDPQQLSDQQKKRMNQEYVTMSTGKITVAPESDSRPAVTLDASPMFAPIEPAAPPLPPFLTAGIPVVTSPLVPEGVIVAVGADVHPLPPMPPLPDWLK